MIVVIIAGGSGTRLWPLSTPSYPKHLLKLTSERSLVQLTLDRAIGLTSPDKIFVVPEKSHIEHIYAQLPEVPRGNILVEPGRRETANCLAFAMNAISRRGLDPTEPIAFFWADHVINNYDGFVQTLQAAGDLSRQQAKIVNIGIKPTYASTGLGYIESGSAIPGHTDAHVQVALREKPDLTTAEHYVRAGNFLWNSGYLVASLEVLERDLQKYGPALWENYQLLLDVPADKIDETYLELDKFNLEYDFREHNPDMLVVGADFDWADVGSHGDLHDISLQDVDGNSIDGANVALENVHASMIRNHTQIPVAVIGLDNVVVIATEAGILVANKQDAQRVKEVTQKFAAQA